ncbi:MAG: peptidase dimerization domain-containing protein, partial [Thermoplasmatota archaeon]
NTLKIQHIEGGNKRNTIPSYSRAVIDIDGNEEDFIERIKKIFSEVKAEYGSVEDEMTLEVKKVGFDDLEVINGEYSKKVIELILALPHGVLSMNQEVPGLVKTSTNLATVSQGDEEIEITMMTRSSSKSELLSNRDRIRVIAENFGAKVEENEAYPGWEPDTDSEILKISKEVFSKSHDDEPKVEAMHAGLETGIINQKYEEMDMISFGATLKGVHTPAEKVEIESVEKLWNLITKISEEFSNKRE